MLDLHSVSELPIPCFGLTREVVMVKGFEFGESLARGSGARQAHLRVNWIGVALLAGMPACGGKGTLLGTQTDTGGSAQVGGFSGIGSWVQLAVVDATLNELDLVSMQSSSVSAPLRRALHSCAARRVACWSPHTRRCTVGNGTDGLRWEYGEYRNGVRLIRGHDRRRGHAGRWRFKRQ